MFGEQKLWVATATGEYADTDLIECVEEGTPSGAHMFQAQYIKYGSIVYQHNTPEELGAALFGVDPESSHDAVLLYKEDEARRQARSEGVLEPTDPVPAVDALQETPARIPEEEEDDVKFFREQAQQETSSTPEVVEIAPEPELPVIEVEEPTPDTMPTSTASVAEPVPEAVVPVEVVEPAPDLSTTIPE